MTYMLFYKMFNIICLLIINIDLSHGRNIGSYSMSDHVLLNLFNHLGEIDEMRGLPSILSLFLTEFNELNRIGARMLDSIIT